MAQTQKGTTPPPIGVCEGTGEYTSTPDDQPPDIRHFTFTTALSRAIEASLGPEYQVVTSSNVS